MLDRRDPRPFFLFLINFNILVFSLNDWRKRRGRLLMMRWGQRCPCYLWWKWRRLREIWLLGVWWWRMIESGAWRGRRIVWQYMCWRGRIRHEGMRQRGNRPRWVAHRQWRHSHRSWCWWTYLVIYTYLSTHLE